ncbi:MAG: hypothetical protein GDA52_05705 [Rhodobacteraceae bacterium]|nr:hypothetical protein [Paracoccaceae bacterium]
MALEAGAPPPEGTEEKQGNLFASVGIVVFFFCISIVLWKISFNHSVWSVLCLIPLFVFVFLGIFRNTLDERRALILSTVRPDSRLLGLLTGSRISPACTAILIAILSVSTVAVHTLLANIIQIAAFLATVAVSTLAYVGLIKIYKPQIQPFALSWFSAATAVVVVSTLYVVLYVPIDWWLVERPSLREIGLNGFDPLMPGFLSQSQRNDVLYYAVKIFQGVDQTYLWFASKLWEWGSLGGKWLGLLLHAFLSAHIGIVVSTSAVGVASFHRHYVETQAWWQKFLQRLHRKNQSGS